MSLRGGLHLPPLNSRPLLNSCALPTAATQCGRDKRSDPFHLGQTMAAFVLGRFRELRWPMAVASSSHNANATDHDP